MSRVFWTAALCAATAMLVGCNRSSPGPSAARLKVDGQVQLDTPRQLFELTSGKHTVHYGDRIKVLSGSAVLERGDGGTLELRRDTEIRFDAHPALLAGSTLAAAGKEPLVVEAAGSSLSVDRGAARLTRTLAVSAASYTGALTIESVGQTLEVPALREATVATAGVLPAHLSPISYDGHNAWDRRYLGVAIELGDQLQARSDGLSSALEPGQAKSAGFFSTVLPALAREHEFQPALLLSSRPAGETLVGATLAELGRQGSFTDRWQRTFAFRDEGATWGLVALDQGITDVTKVTGNLDAAIGRAPLLLAAPAPVAVNTPAVAVAVAAPAPAQTRAPAPVAAPKPAPAPPGVVPPVTVPPVPTVVIPPPTTGTPLDAVLDPLTETVNKLLGVL
ncbi:MAG TPA: hypothetical protein VFA83_17350 [Acidimicrobiales bacterium]|nr:hypothetical protein [Acidimicrobiales bacterium]